MCDVYTYENDDQILQDLLETNIRQRGDVGGSVKKFEKKIQEQAKENQILGGGDKKSPNRVSPDGEKRSVHLKPTHTDKELAKLAGVGTGTIARFNRVMSSDDEVMEWMLDIQLGRRNLSPIQRIAVAEKYRPIYERQAQNNLKEGGRKGRAASLSKPLPNLVNPISTVDTTKKLSDIAGVGKETYRMGAKILQSDDEQLKREVLSGQKSISAGYKELTKSTDEPNSAQRKREQILYGR